MPTDSEIRPLRQNVVRIDAVVFHDPFAAVVRRPKRKFRRGDIPAVVQRNPTGDADEPAPGARAHDGPDLLPMEEPGEGAAPRAGELVDDHDLGTVNRHGRPRDIFPLAWGERGEEFAAEFLRVKVRNLPAGIVAFIDDDAVLIELRGELLVEGDDTGEGCVRHVHVSDAAVSRLRDLAAVLLHPYAIARPDLGVSRPQLDFTPPYGRV